MSYTTGHIMWRNRMQSFKESGEKNVASRCRKNQLNVNSMYNWLGKIQSSNEGSEPAHWVSVQLLTDSDVDFLLSIILV